MPDDPQEDQQNESVNAEEGTDASDDAQESVEPQPEGGDEGTQTSSEPASELGQPETETVDDSGVPWKNRAIEAERKYQDIPNLIRQSVEELTRNQQPKQPEQPQYTIEQLETFAQANPHQRGWVEAQKAQIIQGNLECTMKTELDARDRRMQEGQIRQQSENWVVNHPQFKDCFVTDAVGNKQWNTAHPLTGIIGHYLNQTDTVTGKRVSERADGIIVAAKMAYADYALNSGQKTASQTAALRKTLRKTQRQTMVTPAGPAAPSSSPRSAVRKSIDNYNKTYDKKDITRAVRSVLQLGGMITEE